jgi:hypothetical protein
MRLWNIPSRVATVGLAVLVVLDVVLVAAALRSTHTSGIDTRPVSSASASAAPVRRSSTQTVTASGRATGTATVSPLQTMLVAVDNQRAWRVGVGSCAAGGANLATTADGGMTWAVGAVHLPAIVRVQPADGRAAFVVGADVNCTAELKTTTDGGGTWVSADTVGSMWFRDPKDPRAVRAPGLSTSHPCGNGAVLDLAVVLSTDSARVLCADGLVRSSTDTGSTWTDVGTVTGAVALAVAPANSAQTFVARVDVPGCTGIQILRVGQSVATSCIRAAMPKDAGHIALSLIKGGGWLAVGDSTMRSTDDLVTWHAS